MMPSEIAMSNNYDWARHEFGMVKLRDKRLDKRLVNIAAAFAQKPNASIPQASGDWANTKATYNFFKNRRVKVEPMLASHVHATKERIREHAVVLCPQDTTYLNHNTHPKTKDLGPIGTHKNKGTLGIAVHDTMAFTTGGLALGLVDLQTWTRPVGESGESKDHHAISIEDKESYKWLKSYEATTALQKQVPQTTLVSISDRESDIYEYFALAIRDPNNPKLLVRATQNRKVDHPEQYLWDFMSRRKVRGTYVIEVPEKPKQPARQAELIVRYARVTLLRPQHIATPNMPKYIKLWAIWAVEVLAPPGAEAISWMLLTTIPICSYEEALEKIQWYMLRWQIELFHKVLKSGCKTEERQLKTTEQLQNCLVVDAVVAWRILLLTKLGRELPDLPCSVVFQEYEWHALYAFVHKTTTLPEKEPTLQEVIRMVAKLGGFLGRKSDGEPGSMTLWRGLHRLYDIAEAWQAFGPRPKRTRAHKKIMGKG